MKQLKNPSLFPLYLFLTALLSVLVLYYSTPTPISEDIEGSVLQDMFVLNEEYEYNDVTDLVNQEKVLEIVSSYSRSKFFRKTGSSMLNVGDMVIVFTGGKNTTLMYLRNSNNYLSTISPNEHTYYMNDSQALVQELLALIPSQT